MELKSRGFLGTFVLAILLANFQGSSAKDGGIDGTRQECKLEGQVFDHGIPKAKCFKCICVNRFVECKQHCPPIDFCSKFEESPDGCCNKCKGCMFKGVKYESYTEWKDPDNPCMVYQCHAGIVTELQVQCYTPCQNPLPPKPGQCCGTCEGCDNSVDSYPIMSSDPCLKCTCSANGLRMCTKKACPVLDCPTNNTIYKEGECCPKCVNYTNPFIQTSHFCVVFNKVLKQHEGHVQDKCTKCTCKNGTTICTRQTCPVLDCSPRHQRVPLNSPNSCCKECHRRDDKPFEFSTKCTYRDEVYESGEERYMDPCTKCRCNNGELRCEKEMCPTNSECPFGSQKVHKADECCPSCVEKSATCMVFGDPHYKTFDGRFYTFKGDGKYQLVADCKEHKFSVRVANAYQTRNSTSTTTKRVSIKVTGLRINLGQKLLTKVNGEKISFPYKRDKVLIDKLNGTIVVRIKDDVKILWNGRSLLEVTVQPKFRKNLCGLCGNFNLNSQDDFRDRRGNVFDERTIQKFGNSWCVGKNCLKRVAQPPKVCLKRKKHDRKYCSFFEISTFKKCRDISNWKQFLKACVADMCDCPSGKCFCESLMAYAQECKRLSIDVSGWELTTGCAGSSSRLKPIPDKFQDKQNRKPKYADLQFLTPKPPKLSNSPRNKTNTIPLN